MPHTALVLLERQGGLARCRDLVRCGVTRRQLQRLLTEGALTVVRADVLSAGTSRPDDEAVRAAVVGLDGVASHTTAARAWGTALLGDAGLDVTVGRDRSRAAWPGATVHRRRLGPEDVRIVARMRVTSPVRTVLDLCLTLPLAGAVAAADCALRAALVTRDELRRACCALPSGHERSRVARVVRLADPLSGSVLESLCRVLFAEAGLPAPLTQSEELRFDGLLLGRVDVAWPGHRLVVETDGYALHADRASYRTDRRRTNALVLDGWRVLRLSWEDVVHHPDATVSVVRAALLHTR